MASRRDFLRGMAGGLGWAGGALLLPRALAADLPAGTVESSIMDALQGKKPLIKRSFRPPNYETPIAFFEEPFTPNDAFFVRYHLAVIPEVDAGTWRLKVGGEAADKPFELSLEALKRDFEAVEIAAVCECSGNRRGLSDPHVPGVEWGYGAMGNARWKGARLKDVLARAGIKKEAVEVAFDGADHGAIEKTPDFIKSIPVWKALDENTLIAYEMNGQPLPHWNGYPARLVVPGWTGTYWLKQVLSVSVLAKPLQGFWMNPAYRIPKGKFPVVDRFVTQEAETTTPITEMVVKSLITRPQPGQRFRKGEAVEARGIAWDGGYGIHDVEVSVDGGQVWQRAALGRDYGRFSFRQWQFGFTPKGAGPHSVMAKATNRQGATQTFELIFNPAGYHNNVVQRIDFQVG